VNPNFLIRDKLFW